MSSVAEQLSALMERADITPEVRQKLRAIKEAHPELEKVGVEGYTVTAAPDYMLPSQFDTLRVLGRLSLEAGNKTILCGPAGFKDKLKYAAPWLVPHLPEWFKDEQNDSFLTEGTYVSLMYHFLDVAFRYPNIKTEFMLSSQNTVRQAAQQLSKYGMEASITTESGTVVHHLVFDQRMTAYADKDGIYRFEGYVARGEVAKPARAAFPRKAVKLTITVEEDNTMTVVTDNPKVTVTINETVKGLYHLDELRGQ